MLLKEMFSAIGAPSQNEEQDVDWIGDFKFFIDNDDKLLSNYFFPAVNVHKKNVGHPNIYKAYMRPLERCLEQYCNKFEIDSPEEKFPKEQLIELAKQIAEEQSKHLDRGDYED